MGNAGMKVGSPGGVEMPASSATFSVRPTSLRLDDVLIRVASREWGPVVQDHRQAGSHSVFVAICGRHVDARIFAREAALRGAAAVVAQGEPPVDFPPGTFWVRVGDDRRALSRLAAAYAGHPSRHLGLTAVTGTNGKTTVTYLLDAIWQADGRRTGRIGTVEIKIADRRLPASMTTPDAPDLQEILRRMREAGVEEVAMEASSHALSQRRMDDVAVDFAILTNVRRDHLDYHRTLRAYRDAKGRLFTRVLAPGSGYMGREPTAILPLEEESAQLFARRTRTRVWWYGMGGHAWAAPLVGAGCERVVAEDVHMEGFGSRFRLVTPAGSVRVRLAVPGAFNVRNALASAAAALLTGVPLEAVRTGLEEAEAAPGRMEVVWRGDASILVDFAHNPDGIAKMAQTARGLVEPGGRLVVVLGAEGEKDRGKRPLMGQAAATWADIVFVTSDSPHEEDPERIVRQVAQGAEGCRAEVRMITDRRHAIREAVMGLLPKDVLVVAGRGPETVQIVGRERIPWSDSDAIRSALNERRTDEARTVSVPTLLRPVLGG